LPHRGSRGGNLIPLDVGRCVLTCGRVSAARKTGHTPAQKDEDSERIEDFTSCGDLKRRRMNVGDGVIQGREGKRGFVEIVDPVAA